MLGWPSKKRSLGLEEDDSACHLDDCSYLVNDRKQVVMVNGWQSL